MTLRLTLSSGCARLIRVTFQRPATLDDVSSKRNTRGVIPARPIVRCTVQRLRYITYITINENCVCAWKKRVCFMTDLVLCCYLWFIGCIKGEYLCKCEINCYFNEGMFISFSCNTQCMRDACFTVGCCYKTLTSTMEFGHLGVWHLYHPVAQPTSYPALHPAS